MIIENWYLEKKGCTRERKLIQRYGVKDLDIKSYRVLRKKSLIIGVRAGHKDLELYGFTVIELYGHRVIDEKIESRRNIIMKL